MRYGVGIDLGTTNSALAWIDLESRTRRVNVLDIQQLVAPGEVGRRPTLPSFLYLPGEHDLPAGATALPWDPACKEAVGELARVQGALVPGRLITSAKSWLCHPAVDRHAPILPWAATPDVERRSPVEVSSRYLAHLAAAFRAEVGVALAETDLVVTVPASFDEVARELTVEAATRAGLGRLTLLEEPQAAFYSWLIDHEKPYAGTELLVCDIGGGTTDFTLIRVEDGKYERTAVGDHLLLGGDNMDLALARRVEKRLASGSRLDAGRFQALVQACRVGKEKLLAATGERARRLLAGGTPGSAPEAGQREKLLATDDRSRDAWTIHLAGRGRGLIGGALQTELTRAEIEETILDGFFPLVAADASPAVVRGGLREFGLPYAHDAAVTRHLAAFLRRHKARPDVVLFNGGVLTAPAIRERILSTLSTWCGRAVTVLENEVPHLAVARGAAYYALARRGEGIRITAGAARAYYVEVEAAGAGGDTHVEGGVVTALCLSGRGDDDLREIEVKRHEFELLTNRPVKFRLLSSSDRADRAGDLVRLPAGTLAELPPIVTVLRFPRSSQDVTLGVRLHVQRTEIGTLDVQLVAPQSGTRWKLAFDLRAAEKPVLATDENEAAAPAAPPLVDEPQRAAAVDGIRRIFAREASTSAIDPAVAMKELVALVGRDKSEWPTPLLRALWEPLKELRGQRGRTADHEARWLNLVGYCLRPGYGFTLDDWRVKEAWRMFNAGMVNDKDHRVRLEWWILWRRVSGGLTRTMQDELHKRIAPHFLPDAKKKGERKPPSPQEAAEMWRVLASLERIAAVEKYKLGEVLLPRLERSGGGGDGGAWSLGRLGGRVPLYGPIDNVLSRAKAERWVERLLALDWSAPGAKEVAFAAAEISRASGDRARDLDEGLRQRVAARLGQLDEGGHRLARIVLEPTALEAREERAAFGEALPAGLRLTSTEGRATDEA